MGSSQVRDVTKRPAAGFMVDDDRQGIEQDNEPLSAG